MIAIICAEPEELYEIKLLMQNTTNEQVGSFKFLIGYISNTKVIAVQSGVGKVHAAMCAQTLIMKYNPKFILNVGVAGAVDKHIKIGDIIIASGAIQHDFDVSAFPSRKRGEIPGLNLVEIPCSKYLVTQILDIAKNIPGLNAHIGTILTGDQFINSAEKTAKLANEFSAIACDMESGAIAQVCYINKTDFGIIRAISDGANSAANTDFNSFIKTSSKTAAKIVAELAKHEK